MDILAPGLQHVHIPAAPSPSFQLRCRALLGHQKKWCQLVTSAVFAGTSPYIDIDIDTVYKIDDFPIHNFIFHRDFPATFDDTGGVAHDHRLHQTEDPSSHRRP